MINYTRHDFGRELNVLANNMALESRVICLSSNPGSITV